MLSLTDARPRGSSFPAILGYRVCAIGGGRCERGGKRRWVAVMIKVKKKREKSIERYKAKG